MESKYYHLIIYCPIEAAERVRRTLADARAGRIGNYDSCSFSSRGIGRFRGGKNSKPAIGKPGRVEQIEEERIEVMVQEKDLKGVLQAVKKAHPYEEPAMHVLPMMDYKEYHYRPKKL